MGKIPWTKLELTKSGSSAHCAWQKLNVPYVEDANALQTVDICVPAAKFSDGAPISASEDLWAIYIHGGAWRDPEISASSFENTQTHLLTEDAHAHTLNKIAGFASINYTLSPYPDHPRLPSDPTDPTRNAKHPDHINDVLRAIHFLQDQYKFGSRFILLGHSCGATLAFQTIMAKNGATDAISNAIIKPPIAIIGLAGLYDLANLVKPSGEAHDEYLDVYEKLLQNAFGNDPESWHTASPTTNSYSESWEGGVLALLAYSPQDSLVPEKQYKLMEKCLSDLSGELRVIQLTGEHDDIWQKGDQVTLIISYAVKFVIEHSSTV